MLLLEKTKTKIIMDGINFIAIYANQCNLFFMDYIKKARLMLLAGS